MNLINKAKSCSRNIALVVGLAGIASTGCTGPGIVGIGGGAILKGNAMRTHDPMAAWVLGDAMRDYGVANESRGQTVVVVSNDNASLAGKTDYVWGPDGKAYIIPARLYGKYLEKGYTPATKDRSIGFTSGTRPSPAPPLDE